MPLVKSLKKAIKRSRSDSPKSNRSRNYKHIRVDYTALQKLEKEGLLTRKKMDGDRHSDLNDPTVDQTNYDWDDNLEGGTRNAETRTAGGETSITHQHYTRNALTEDEEGRSEPHETHALLQMKNLREEAAKLEIETKNKAEQNRRMRKSIEEARLHLKNQKEAEITELENIQNLEERAANMREQEEEDLDESNFILDELNDTVRKQEAVLAGVTKDLHENIRETHEVNEDLQSASRRADERASKTLRLKKILQRNSHTHKSENSHRSLDRNITRRRKHQDAKKITLRRSEQRSDGGTKGETPNEYMFKKRPKLKEDDYSSSSDDCPVRKRSSSEDSSDRRRRGRSGSSKRGEDTQLKNLVKELSRVTNHVCRRLMMMGMRRCS
jgi:hypothetical protein